MLNYKTTPNWGEEAKKLTGGRGADVVIEVAGPTSMRQSINAVKICGMIAIIGFVGGVEAKDQPSFLECLTGIFTARGVLVGSREQLEELCRAIDANTEKLRPLLDQKVWKLKDAKDAYQHMVSSSFHSRRWFLVNGNAVGCKTFWQSLHRVVIDVICKV